MTSCLLLLVVLFLIGLGLGDSPLVILSICSLVLSFVFSFFFSASYQKKKVFSFFCLFVSFSILFVLPFAFFT